MLLYWMRIQKLLYNSVLPTVRELTDLPDHLVIILPTMLRTFPTIWSSSCRLCCGPSRPPGHHPANHAVDPPDHLVIILPTMLRTFPTIWSSSCRPCCGPSRPSGHHPADHATNIPDHLVIILPTMLWTLPTIWSSSCQPCCGPSRPSGHHPADHGVDLPDHLVIILPTLLALVSNATDDEYRTLLQPELRKVLTMTRPIQVNNNSRLLCGRPPQYAPAPASRPSTF